MKQLSKLHDFTFEKLMSEYHRSRRSDMGFALRIDTHSQDVEGVGVMYRDFFGICMVLRGSGTHLIDGVPYSIVRGDVYVILPGTEHAWLEVNRLDLVMAHFTIRAFTRSELAALTSEPGFQSLVLKNSRAGTRGGRWLHLSPSEQDSLMHIVFELSAELSTDSPIKRLLAHGLFFRMLALLSRMAGERGQLPERPAHTATDDRLAHALAFLEENFADHVSLDDVASVACLSPTHFTRLFVAQIGCAPRDYLRHLRLERAKGLLAATEQPIGWISHESGFSEATYFARVFRDSTGMTPRAYRRTTRGL